MMIGSFVSFFIPSAIVCNAESVRNFHASKRYSKKRLKVIPNGFYIHREQSRINFNNIRGTYSINDKAVVIGTVGRYDDLKDYPNLINACSLIMNEYKNVHLIMVGRGLDNSNADLMSILYKKLDLSRVHLLGERSDVSGCLNAIDIFCLPSHNEGFPNVLCEAMLMSKPCVTTSAGDSASIVSHTGIIVPINDHLRLASGLKHMIEIGASCRERLGSLSFSRIESHYSVDKNISRFNKLYLELLDGK
jgi:glycosyltransferase involved in cell wall biosynthesis